MKNHIKNRFTLIELLAVIAIIAILAGLLVPAVMGAQTQARITQAKSDMATITQALRALESTYGKLYSLSGKKPAFGGKRKSKNVAPLTKGKSGDGANTFFTSQDDDSDDAYDLMIVELSDPGYFTASSETNKRKIRFLDPKADYVPDSGISDTQTLWRDPWGNRYVVMFCSSGDNILVPHARKNGGSNHKLATDLAIYSLGPNAKDDYGTNKELDPCENIAGADDVATWHK